MHYRTLGKTGWKVSDISLGAWQLGGKWGNSFDEQLAERTLLEALDNGINFIDTADVYSAGLSERAVGKFVRSRSERIYVATKCGRRLDPHTAAGYTAANINRFVDESLQNTGLEVIDLLQLHCPPTEVYERADVFEALDRLREAGKILHYGVSVEKVAEAHRALAYPDLATVQIIFNMVRHKPAETLFAAAQDRQVGIIVRVPLASGLLTGKFAPDTRFEEGDHRFFNQNGEAFDKGETFSGISYQTGMEVVREFKRLFGEAYLTQSALRWILMHEAVSCVIPGASHPDQVKWNAQASYTPALPAMAMDDVRQVYDKYVRQYVHHLW
ncbi:MAG: aldo/keto reductase [Bacteroidia bacterium]|nr:aldo/keto reductase [Bacteroidia bacterium]